MKAFFTILVSLTSLLVMAQTPQPAVRYKLEYDYCTNEYVVKIKPTINLISKNINTSSTVSIVFPINVSGTSLVTTTSAGAANWSTSNLLENYYGVVSGYGAVNATYKLWYPLGSVGKPSYNANTEYEMFRFTYGVVPQCLSGIRLYVNGTDYDDPLYDWNQYFVYTNTNPSDDFYLNNVSNLTPPCFQYDFGDLTAAWPQASAVMFSPDCNNDGIPDGTTGAVWAGAVIDADVTQKFSSTTSLANGDDIDGRNDEDGLTPPTGPLSFGFTYPFTITPLTVTKAAKRCTTACG